MKRIRGWSAVAAVVVFTLCLATPASSQTARGPATRFLPTHPIDYPDTPPPVDYTGEPDWGGGALVLSTQDLVAALRDVMRIKLGVAGRRVAFVSRAARAANRRLNSKGMVGRHE